MPKPKIDKVKLSQLLRSGKSQKEVAQVFGVSEGAITHAKKALNLQVVRNVALENAHRVVDKVIDRMVKAVQGALTYEADPKKQTAYIRKIVKQITQDRFLALKAMQEIRGQLSLQLDIFKTLYDMEAIAEFQREVLEAIGEVNDDVRNRIIQRLKEARTLRGSLSVS